MDGGQQRGREGKTEGVKVRGREGVREGGCDGGRGEERDYDD